MKSRMRQPTPISEVLRESSKNAPMADKMRRYAIWDRWAGIVGTEVAAHARPARWQGNVLVVRVEHPAWIQELGFLKPQMMEKLKRDLPKTNINDIRFEVGQLPPAPESAPSEGPFREEKLSDQEKEFVESTSAEIADPDLREAAVKAMSKYLSSKHR